MSGLVSKLSSFIKQYPVARGMMMYSLIWPASSLIQQSIEGKRYDTYDWLHCLRFCVYGSLFVAPTLYGWVRTASMMWPHRGLKHVLIKAGVEQISYTPFAMMCFFFGMSLLEMRPLHECVEEVLAKFPQTYKVGLFVWPVVATVNFAFIPGRHRVAFVSLCSSLWTYFLAYMKHINNAPLEALVL